MSSPRALEMADGKSSSFHIEWITRRLLELGADNRDTILDFGAGAGALLQRLSELGFSSLHGIDLLPPPALKGIGWRQVDLNDGAAIATAPKYDWITCVEVIEHLENPRQVLRAIHSLLKPGGTLLLTTPNVESLRSVISFWTRGHFVDFLDTSYPAHITPLVPMDLCRILNELKFETKKVTYSNRGAVPGITSLSWQKLSLGALGGKRFSDHVLAVARKDA